MKNKILIWILSISCGVVVVAATLIVLFLSGAFLNPKQRVMLALSKTFGGNSIFAMASGNTDNVGQGLLFSALPTSDDIDYISIMKKAQEETLHTDFNFTIEDYDDYYYEDSLDGAGFSIETATNLRKHQYCSNFGITYDSLNYHVANLYLDEMTLNMEIPLLYDGYISADLTNFGEDYNDSALCELLDAPISEDDLENLELDPWKENQDSNMFYGYTFSDEQYEAVCEFYESIEVEKTGNKEEFDVGEDTLKCTEYKVIIESDNLLDLFDAYDLGYEDIEGFEDAIKEDPEILIYLDNKGRMIAGEFEASNMEFSFAFCGEENLCDSLNAEGEFTREDYFYDGEDYTVSYELEYTTTMKNNEQRKDFTLNFKDSDDDSGSISGGLKYNTEKDSFRGSILFNVSGYAPTSIVLEFNGSLSSDTPGKDISYDLDEITISNQTYDESFTFSIHGSIEVDGDDVDTASGEKYEILEMSESELEDFADEIEDKFSSLEDMFY